MYDGQTQTDPKSSDQTSVEPTAARDESRDDLDLPNRDIDAEASDGRAGEIGTLVEAICVECRLTRAKRTRRVDPDDENPTVTFKHVCHDCQSATWWNTLRVLEDAQRNESIDTGDGIETDGGSRREDLIYDGICPICDEEFIDGYGSLEEGESYKARICVDEIDGNGEGKMLVHLPDVDTSNTDTDRSEEGSR